MVSSMGVPQGTVLSLVLFTFYMLDLHTTQSPATCKCSLTTLLSWGVSGVDSKEEYRKLIKDFVEWCELNHLLLNTSKIREVQASSGACDHHRRLCEDCTDLQIPGSAVG